MNSCVYAGSSGENSSSSTLPWSKHSPESGPDLLLRWQSWDRALYAPSGALKSLGHTRLSKLTITSTSAWNTVGSDLRVPFTLFMWAAYLHVPIWRVRREECRSCAMHACWKWSRFQYLPPRTQRKLRQQSVVLQSGGMWLIINHPTLSADKSETADSPWNHDRDQGICSVTPWILSWLNTEDRIRLGQNQSHLLLWLSQMWLL